MRELRLRTSLHLTKGAMVELKTADSIRSRRDRRLRREEVGRRASISIVALRCKGEPVLLGITDREILLHRDGRVSLPLKMKSSRMTRVRTIQATEPSHLFNKATHLTSIAMVSNLSRIGLSRILLVPPVVTLSCSKKLAFALMASSALKPMEIKIDRHMIAMEAQTLMKMYR